MGGVVAKAMSAGDADGMRRMDKDSKQNQVVNLRGCYGVADPEWRVDAHVRRIKNDLRRIAFEDYPQVATYVVGDASNEMDEDEDFPEPPVPDYVHNTGYGGRTPLSVPAEGTPRGGKIDAFNVGSPHQGPPPASPASARRRNRSSQAVNGRPKQSILAKRGSVEEVKTEFDRWVKAGEEARATVEVATPTAGPAPRQWSLSDTADTGSMRFKKGQEVEQPGGSSSPLANPNNASPNLSPRAGGGDPFTTPEGTPAPMESGTKIELSSPPDATPEIEEVSMVTA
mmetsp:Transcript_47501/g.113096  ORF Transcript_47501/g.113096 Transcript_47501/m.113096 type:complete len:284 (-) Transcript_47501:88-939(-)